MVVNLLAMADLVLPVEPYGVACVPSAQWDSGRNLRGGSDFVGLVAVAGSIKSHHSWTRAQQTAYRVHTATPPL